MSIYVGDGHPRGISNHARQVRDTVDAKGASSIVASSWRRCFVLHNLDPDTPQARARRSPAAIESAREANRGLIDAARPYLAHIARLFEQTEASVLLSDSDGLIIDERAGGSHDFWTRTIEPWTGIDFSERSEGTNAIGTSLYERRALTIVAGQHYYARNTEMACSGAPIFDPFGNVAGGLDITRPAAGEAAAMAQLCLAVAIGNAVRIEVALFRAAFPEARLTLAPGSANREGMLIAIDANDMVVGATHGARQMLDLSPTRMRTPFPASELWRKTGEDHHTLVAIERRAIEQALARNKDNISAAARVLGIGRGTLHRKMAFWRD